MKKITLLSLGLAAATLTSQASVISWQGGTGAFGDANWTVDGTSNQLHSSFSPNIHQTTIGSGSVSGFQTGNMGIINNDTVTLTGGASVSGTDITFGTPTPQFNLANGSMTFSDANAFRSTAVFDGFINFTGTAGSATVAQTDNSVVGSALAIKMKANSGTTSYFAIDGTMIVTTVAYDGSNIAEVNTDLAEEVVNGRYFQITDAGAGGTQTLNVIPEPAALGMVALFGGGLLFVRRKLMM